MYLDRFTDQDLTVIVSEMLIASADSSDVLLDGAMGEVLRRLREKLRLDVVFVSEFVDGRRVFRFVDGEAGNSNKPDAGDDEPLEATYCKRVVDGRLPELVSDVGRWVSGADRPTTVLRVGTHLSTPVVLRDGSVYGTLCCYSAEPTPSLREQDLFILRQCARLVARKLEIERPAGEPDTVRMPL